MSSVSFTDFEDYKKQTIENSSNVVDFQINDIIKHNVNENTNEKVNTTLKINEYSGVIMWVHNINNSGDNLSFKKKEIVNELNVVNNDKFTSSIFFGQVHPKIIQIPTTFCVTWIGYIKIFIKGNLFIEKQVNTLETATFDYTFLSNNPVNILCNYKSFENNSHFELKCCTDNIESYSPEISSNDTHKNFNFEFDNIVNPFGESLKILGKDVSVDGNLSIKGTTSVSNVKSEKITSDSGNISSLQTDTISTSKLTIDEFGIIPQIEESRKVLLFDSSEYKSITFNSKQTNFDELCIQKGNISHDNNLSLVINQTPIVDVSSDNVIFNKDVVFCENVVLKNDLNIKKLSIGLSDNFNEPSIIYPLLGKCNIIGDKNDPESLPNINIFYKNEYNPVFQLHTSDGTSLNFDCFYDSFGTLQKSRECEFFQIKKNGNVLEFNSNGNGDGDIMSIDLFSKKVEFKECLQTTKGIKVESTIQFNGNVNLGVRNSGFYISNIDAIDILSVSENGLLTMNDIKTNTLSVNETFNVTDSSISLELDLTTTRPIYSSNTQDTSQETNENIPSIYTLGGAFINKHLHVNRGISTKRIVVNSVTPCITMDSSGSSLSLSEPLLGTGGIGAKIILQVAKFSDETDVALGTSKNGLWYSTTNKNSNHSWYFGKQKVMNLDGSGKFEINGKESNIVLDSNGIKLNGENVKVCLNDSIYLGHQEDTFYIRHKQETLLSIDNIECVVNSNKLKTRNIDVSYLRCDESIAIGSTLKLFPNFVLFQNNKLIEWGNNMLNIKQDIVSIDSDKCNIITNVFQISNGSNECLLNCNNGGIEIFKPINVIDLYGNNCIFESIQSSGIITKTIESENVLLAGGIAIGNGSIQSTDKFEIKCKELSIPSNVHVENMVSCNSLTLKDGVRYFDGKYKNLKVSNSIPGTETCKFYYIGKLNTTDSGFGLDESGKFDIELRSLKENKIVKTRITASIHSGELNVQKTTDISTDQNENKTDSILVYKELQETKGYNVDYHVFLCIKPMSIVYLDVYSGGNEITEIDEGNGLLPDGNCSGYSKSWIKVYDSSNEECNSLINTGSINCNDTTTTNDLVVKNDFSVQKDIRFSDSTSFYISGKKVSNYSQDILSLNLNLESNNNGNIGSISKKWNELHVNNIDSGTLNTIGCNVIGDTVLNDASIKNCKIETLDVKNTVTETLYIKRGLDVGKGVTLKDTLTVDGKTTFKDSIDSKNVNVFGILKTNVIASSQNKPLKIRSNSLHIQDNLKIELDKTECKISTMYENILMSPGGFDLLKLGINGKIRIGSRPEYTLSPLVDLVVYGKVSISEGITVEKDLKVNGTLSVNSVKVNSLYSTTSNKIYLENVNDCIKLYPNGQINNYVCIDSDLNITSNAISCQDITTETLRSNKLNVSQLFVDKVCVSNLCVMGDVSKLCDTINFNNNGGLCIEISNSENKSCFNFTNDGSGIFKSERISVNELTSLSSVSTQDLSVSHNIFLSDTIEFKKVKDSLEITNKRGNVNLFAAGNKGLSITQVTGNASLSGLLVVNSGLDLFTTGELDINSASLLVKGGASILGSLSVNKNLIIGNILLKSQPQQYDQNKELIEFTLPTSYPETNDQHLLCNPQGELSWGKTTMTCNHICHNKPIYDYINCITINSTTNQAIKVEAGETLLKECTITELSCNDIKTESMDSKEANIETLKISKLEFENFGQLSGIIPGKKLIGESKSDKVLVEIVFKNSLPNTKYHITGNLVSTDPNDNLNNVYICSFKKLTTTGCIAIIKILDSDELTSGWTDKTLQLHYLITI
jgi:hypothetical protein